MIIQVKNIKTKQDISQSKVLLCGIGLTCLISNSIVLYVSFLWAYFSNDYVFSVRINDFGEAHIEFFLLPLTILLGLYSIIVLFKNMPRKKMVKPLVLPKFFYLKK